MNKSICNILRKYLGSRFSSNGIRFSSNELCYPLKNKKVKTVLNAFIEIVNEFNHKPNKLLVDQRREFCKKLMQEWLDNNDILMYSTHNEVKSVIAEEFKSIKAKIY